MNSRLDIGATKRSPQIQGVNATAGGLLKATLGASVLAGAILIFAWLPAEYGIDPTGVGQVLGLTEMGQIKEQLHAEAEADAEATATAEAAQANSDANAAANLLSPAAEPAVDVAELNEKLDAIQAQLQAIALSTGVSAPSSTEQTNTETTSAEQAGIAPAAEANWRDELNYTLTPGQGIEVKLVMDEGAVAEYEWSANGSVLNYDTHANGSGQKISYEQGRAVPGQAGKLTAAFTGNHGWFWRNRTEEDVVVTLRTRGDYKGLVLP